MGTPQSSSSRSTLAVVWLLRMTEFLKAFGLFTAPAIFEIVGCYLPYLWHRRNGSA